MPPSFSTHGEIRCTTLCARKGEAARRYTRKDARINIRLSTADLEMLKRRAAEEGLPYQSLIANIWHKYISCSAPQTN
jgi:predicted DNA binding CopG/RHH family protein